MTIYRTLQEIEREPDLTAAECKLLAECGAGEGVIIGTSVPGENTPDKTIRAGIIRYLMLGGCRALRPHEKGVRISGAHIPDALDLQGCDSDLNLVLLRCRLSAPLTLMDARLRGVILTGSHCLGKDNAGRAIIADRLKTTGGVFLSGGFRAEGAVRLLGAEIGGNLACDGATLVHKDGAALLGDGLKTTGGVFLGGGFRAEGSVRLLGAEIGGDLACVGGEFECEKETYTALQADNARIGGTLFWRDAARARGVVNLTRATVSALNDERACWPKGMELNGFTYGSISGGPVDADARLDWLARSDALQEDFQPQPYQQLAKVLREMGHEDDARIVLMEKERRQRTSGREALRRELDGIGITARAQIALSKVRQTLSDKIIGFGYRPFRAIWTLLFLTVIGWALFAQTWAVGNFAPNSDVILISDSWAAQQQADNPAQAWLDAKRARDGHGVGEDYETFLSLAYAADVVIPIIDFGQEAAWAPTTEGWWGAIAWVARWVLKLLGWIAAALGAAAVTGVVRRD